MDHCWIALNKTCSVCALASFPHIRYVTPINPLCFCEVEEKTWRTRRKSMQTQEEHEKLHRQWPELRVQPGTMEWHGIFSLDLHFQFVKLFIKPQNIFSLLSLIPTFSLAWLQFQVPRVNLAAFVFTRLHLSSCWICSHGHALFPPYFLYSATEFPAHSL